MENGIREIMRFAEFSDSAFPIGSFSFSIGIETAADLGLVSNADNLERYVENAVHQTAMCDAVAALHAYRAGVDNDYDAVAEADRRVILCKMNSEARMMTLRMGRKTAELGVNITADPLLTKWLKDIVSERMHGTFPVSQALLFAACRLGERQLYAAHIYGTVNTLLGAALRCVRVSHYQTQTILFRMTRLAELLYKEVGEMELDDMNVFSPQSDILASLHEKGTKRMFMN